MKSLNTINQKEALRYLGYVGENPDESIQLILNESEKHLIEIIEPRYIYRCFDLDFLDNQAVLNGCKLKLVGKDINNHLNGCEKAILMCATLSVNVDRFIRVTQVTDMTKAVIIDSLASVAIEQICDNIQEEIADEFKNYHLTFRYSPGYGDFPIELQKDFLNVLNAPKKIGLTATEDSILTPKKSVTAIIGLSKSEIEKVKKDCQDCNLHETCIYRKRGERCAI